MPHGTIEVAATHTALWYVCPWESGTENELKTQNMSARAL